MAQLTLPNAPAYKRTSYSGLLGADFSVDPSLVDKRHSPDLLNMISDNGGNPVKRKGWEVVKDYDNKEIENVWSFYMDDQRYIVYTVAEEENASLHCMNEEGVEFPLNENEVIVKTGKHCGFFTNTSEEQYGFYIIDGEKYHRLYVDNGAIQYGEVEPYVPTVLISRTPTGGGQVYEDINLLTRKRKEEFYNDPATNKTFVLSAEVASGTDVVFEYRTDNTDAGWAVDSSATVTGGSTVTVTTAHAPISAGVDNIRITYTAAGTDKSDYILNCQTCAHFSATIQDQIFLTGNPDKPNSVFYSGFNNFGYFPDLNYINIGGDNKIMGFLNLGEYLAIVKEGTSDDSTIFLIYQTSISSKATSIAYENTSTTKTTTIQDSTFAVKRSVAGIGAVSRYAFGVLNDEPLFLSEFGVYGVMSVNTTSEKIARNRSFFVDQKLTKEENLDKAISIVWNNYYMVFINSHVYILDGRHKTNNAAGNTSYGYECYYWEGVPAKSVCSYGKEIWFGTTDGRLCRFKNSGSYLDYSDGTVRDDSSYEGTAIHAVWSTPNDNDGVSEYFKTMQKKGTMCTVAPFQRSSVKVYLSPDGYPKQYIGMTIVDISGLFDGEIDFGRLSFDPRTSPRDSFFRRKQKKYIRLQIFLENDTLNEPFGVFEIVKTYVITRFAKNTTFVQGKGTPYESPIFQRHTITVETDEGEEKSIDINGTRWQ